MSFWLHRISHEWEVSYPLFDMEFLSLGWHKFSSCDILARVEKSGVTGFNSFMSEQNETSRSRWNLWCFSQFKGGDTVVVPLFGGEFAICSIVGNPFSVSNKNGITLKNKYNQNITADENGFYHAETSRYYDIGFLVQVKELKRIPRSYADANLVSRMKIRQTNACIDDLSESVNAALSAKSPTSLHDTILEATTSNISDTVKKHLTPDKLESIIKWYMQKKGADRAYIPSKNEKGKENGADADIIAEFDDLRVIFYIQVKKHSGETNEWAVHQISEYQRQKRDDTNDYTYISWVVSTADFSETAILQAKENDIRLVGGNDLIKMLLNCGINGIDEA